MITSISAQDQKGLRRNNVCSGLGIVTALSNRINQYEYLYVAYARGSITSRELGKGHGAWQWHLSQG